MSTRWMDSIVTQVTVVAALLFFLPVQAQADLNSPQVQYYPGGSTSIEVGKEEFLKNYASLAGIAGVYVNLDYVYGSSKKNDIAIKDDLEQQVRAKFKEAGLRYLSEEDLLITPGMPEIAVYPSYTGGGLGEAKPDQRGVGNSAEENLDCCRNSVWMSFSQSATILRRPNSHFKLGTWGAGEDSDWCKNRGEWMYDAVLRTVDLFVADYKKAETEKKPVKIANAEEIPSNCAQAWAVHLQVFDTNSTEIKGAFVPILDKLVAQSARCQNYNYVIETHADQRADDNYNKILSEARAGSIKEYLMGSGIAYNRLKTIAYGESKPLRVGNTEEDHAANRRVVIVPALGPIVNSQADQ